MPDRIRLGRLAADGRAYPAPYVRPPARPQGAPLLAVNGEEVGPLMSGYSEKNGLEGFVYHYRVAGDGPGTYSCVPRLSFGGGSSPRNLMSSP